jgi:hypothetical protein
MIRITRDWAIKNTNTDSLLEMNATANLMVGKRVTGTANFAEATRYLGQRGNFTAKYNGK